MTIPLRAVFVPLYLLLVSCGGDSFEPLRCERNNALIDERGPCVEDDDCPCGSGCELGQCRAACRSNSDCDGQRCSEFGRCAANDAPFIPALEVAAAPSSLILSTSALEARTGTEAMQFTVRGFLEDTSATTIRVVPSEGLSIHCAEVGQSDPGSARAESCEVALQGAIEVAVVPVEALAPGQSGRIAVHWNNQSEEVSYFLPSDAVQFANFDPEGALSGLYEGTATLQQVGAGIVPASAQVPTGLDGTTGGLESAAEITVPVSLEVFDGSGGYLVRLSDPYGALSPAGFVEAQLIDAGNGSLRWIADSHAYIESALVTEADDDDRGFLNVAARYGFRAEDAGALTTETVWPTMAQTDLEAGRVNIELPVFFDTLAHPQRAPAAVWMLSLGRISDLAADAIAPVASPVEAEVHAPALDTGTRLALTRWEAAMADKLVDGPEQGSFLTGASAAGASLSTCTNASELSPAAQSALYQELTLRTLGELVFDEPNATIAGDQVVVSRSGPGTIEAAGPLPALVAQGLIGGGTIPQNSFSSTLNYSMRASIPAFTRTIISGGEPIEYLDLPCGVGVGMAFFNVSTSTSNHNTGSIVFDICDELSARTGCLIHDRAEFFTLLTADTFVTSGNTGSSAIINSAWIDTTPTFFGRTLNKFCTMPEVPLACADAVQCHSGEAIDGLSSSSLVDTFISESGDAICEGSFRSFALDADDNTASLTAGEMFTACTAELQGVANPPAPSESFFETLSSAACLNHARFFTALGAASQKLRVADIAPVTWPTVDSAAHMTQRLLVQWIHAHGFIASEMNEQHILQDILRRDPVPGTEAPPTLETVLPTSLRGWDLLLHPRFSNVIDNIPGAALAVPDYRLQRFGSTIPVGASNDPADSLPEAMLDTLRSQADLATRALERARLRGDASTNAIRAMSPVLRYTVVIDSMAEELASRALAACELDVALCNGSIQPPWYQRFERAQVRTNSALKRMISTANALVEGKNPLGIEDSDVPLYFANTPETEDGRFFAISDYFIGASPEDIRAWAPPLIEEAEEHLQSSRSKWVERQDRVVATRRDDLARQNRVIDAKTLYGERIVNLCGRPGDLIGGDALDRWEIEHGRPFSSTDCFLDLGNVECRAEPAESLDLFHSAEAGYSVCNFRQLDALISGPVEYADIGITQFARTCAPESVSYIEAGCDTSSTGACLRCADDGVADAAVVGGDFLQVLVPQSASANVVNTARETCRTLFPDAIVPLPTTQDKTGDLPSTCFRGAIGEQAAAIRSVATEIDIARRKLTELNDAYDIAVSACNRKRMTGETLLRAQAAHNGQMTTLRAVKLVADIAAEVAGGVKDCSAAVSGAGPAGGASTGAACAAGAVEVVANSVSLGMDFAIGELESAFDLDNLQVEVEGEHAVCIIESRQYVVGTQSQGLRIRRAMEDLDVANVVFANRRARAEQAFDDGLATVAFEQGRRLSPLNQDLWLDEDVRAFDRSFRIARRVTYLSVLAVEYEFQQNIGLGSTVLAAQLPADLTAVLRELRTFTGARSVFGSRPTQRKAILSLRDQLLDLEDRSDVPAGEINMTPTERLQLRLRSPNNAVFAADSTYLGQEITFSLTPGGVGPQFENSSQIFSQDSCAERLWSVNASILGGDELLRGQATTFTDITIKKANTFFSQWCDDNGNDTPFQLASVRPERNLFRDPESAGASFIESQLSSLVGKSFSKALIQPSLNVERIDFEDDQYENGDSSQLAARGLYGEYTIFFPAQTLSILRNGSQSDGLDLSKVDDVLLRFDYISAAR